METEIQVQINVLDEIQLDKIIDVNFNDAVLRKNFEIIIKFVKEQKRQMDLQSQLIAEQKAKNDSQDEIIEKLTGDLAKNMEDISGMKQVDDKQDVEISENRDNLVSQGSQLQSQHVEIVTVKDENVNVKVEVKDYKDRIEKIEGELGDSKKIIEQNKQEIEALKLQISMLGQPSGGGVDPSALKGIMEEIQKLKDNMVMQSEFNEDKEKQDGEINKLWESLKDLQSKYDALNEKLDSVAGGIQQPADLSGLEEQLKQLQAQVDEVKTAVDTKAKGDEMKEAQGQIKYILECIQKLSEGKTVEAPPPVTQGVGLSEEDMQKIQDCFNKIKDLELLVKQLQKELGDHKNSYSDNKDVTDKRLDNLEKQIKQCVSASDLLPLQNEVKEVRDSFDTISSIAHENEKKIRDLRKQIQELKDMMGGQKGDGGISEELVDRKINALRDELMALIKSLQNDIEKKVNYDDLFKSEALILDKVDQIAGALMKKLADGPETKKALIYLEKKINQLYMLMTKDKVDDDGLLVKKQLLWSCASCDKELDKYKGKLGEYRNWAIFPPKETTPERMGRFGKGYKNLLDRNKDEKSRMGMSGELPQIGQKQ